MNYRNFKNDFEQMNKDLGNQRNLTYQEYEELHYAYNDIQDSYNAFLGIVRADLSDYKTIKLRQDIDVNTVLPTKDCSVAPPANRYFTIRGAGTQENFCVLLTKSQLDPQDLAKRLEAETGSLNERLTKVFGKQIISPKEAQVSIENNRINFDVGAAKNNVLPMVFVIQRK